MRRITIILAASCVALLALSACGTGDPTATPPPNSTPTTPTQPNTTAGIAPVDSIDVKVLESKPPQAQATVKGYLPDPCTTLSSISQSRDGNTFTITLATARETGKACIEVIQPYEQAVTLDVAGLTPGTYTAIANGVSTTFELTAANVAP